MKTSESITNIAVALHKFHGLMGKVGKDATNPHFKNKYASLSNIIEATTPHLNAVGLSIIQLPCESGLETMLLHTSGEYISSVSLTSCKDASKKSWAIFYFRFTFILGWPKKMPNNHLILKM